MHAQDYARCIQEQGFGAKAVGAAVTFDDTSDSDGLNQAAANCDSQVRSPDPVEWNEKNLRKFYDHLVGHRECLVRVGLSPSEAPTFETWKQQWRETEALEAAGKGERKYWDPELETVANVEDDRIVERVARECPAFEDFE